MNNIIKTILRKCGYLSTKEFDILTANLSKSYNECDKLNIQNKKLQEVNVSLTRLNNDLPYNFDFLLELWTPEQLNALIYKAINTCRNDPEKVELVQRWKERTTNALQTLENHEEGTN